MLISCAVTIQLICVFVFASAKSGFSHDVAQLIDTSFSVLHKSMLWVIIRFVRGNSNEHTQHILRKK